MQNEIELQIGKWEMGQFSQIGLPKHISKALHLKSKDKMSCAVENDKLILKTVRPIRKYTLAELLAKAENSGEEISWGAPHTQKGSKHEKTSYRHSDFFKNTTR